MSEKLIHESVPSTNCPKDSYILLEHICAIDKTRLRNFIGRIEAPTIKKVNQAICISLDIKKEET